jgi:Zn-dependent peptidase ImmA (M78 family)
MQLPGGIAAIALSFRHLTDDHFWFTFFHEAAHLLLHRDGRPRVDTERQPESNEEVEADRFSAEILIPVEHRAELASIALNWRAITRFALRVGVSPGIILGQLQHDGRIAYDRLNWLKRRYTWSEPFTP